MGKKSRQKREKAQQAQGEGAAARRDLLVISLIVLTFILGALLRITNPAVPDNGRSPDEMVYTRQAKTILHHGTEGIRMLVREYNSKENLWKYPPPIRVGYLWTVTAAMKITGAADARAGTYVSSLFSIISLIVLTALCLRFFNQAITLYALLMMSASPMALTVARRSWQEAMLGCIGFLLVYISCELTRLPKKLIWYAMFILTGTCCLLIKSTGVVIYGLCMIWIMWVVLVKRRDVAKSVFLVAFSVLGSSASLAFLIYSVGGLGALREVLVHFKWGVETSEYARDYASGPWYHFFYMLWMMNPLNTVLLFIGGIGSLFLLGRDHNKEELSSVVRDRAAVLGIVFFCSALLAVLFITKEHPLNLRYVHVLNGPFYILGGLGLWYILVLSKKALGGIPAPVIAVVVSIALIWSVVTDHRNYNRVVVSSGIRDSSIRLLREASRFAR